MAQKILALLLGIVASAFLVYGQEFRATLTGRVLDSGGNPVANAKVRVTNTATGETRRLLTDTQGIYLAPLLNPGAYSVRAEADGFKVAIQSELELSVNQNATLDLKLELGSVKTEVTVTSQATLLEDTNADRGALIDEQSVKEYPLNSRNAFMLAMLTPGVNFDGELTYQRPFDNGAIANWSINGSQQREFMLDGAPNNSQAGGNNIAFVPPVDSVQEFKIQTNAYDAQYRGAGGIINVALKSGGNHLHGALYEFARRSAWDAKSFQNKARCVSFDANGKCQGAPKDGHYLDQYGVQLDGPVFLPKLYNGRNKTFFLLNYERYREGSPQPLILSVPQPEMRQGDFSKLVDARGRAITIYDPNTGRQVGANWVRDPFPNNVIPAGRINPTAAQLIKYFPQPNTTTAGVNYSSSNYFISGGDASARDRFYNLVAKIDINLSDRQHLSVRYGQNDRTEMRTYNGIFDKPGADGQLPLRRANWTGAVDWTSTMSTTTVVDVRASMSRFIDPSTADPNKSFDLVGAGFAPSLVSQLPYGEWFPRISISGFQALGRNPNFGATATNSNSRGLMTFVGNQFNFVNTLFEIPHVDQFSLSVQRSIGTRARIDVAYVGSRGKRLQSNKTFNEDGDSSIRDQCNYLLGATSQSYCTQGLANPFRNLPGFEGTAFYTNSTRSRHDLNRLYPQFNTSLTEYMRNDGLSWYNALQGSYKRDQHHLR